MLVSPKKNVYSVWVTTLTPMHSLLHCPSEGGRALKTPLIHTILSDTLKGNASSSTSGYPQLAGRQGAKAMGAALSWNDSVTPFSLLGKERGGKGGWGGWEGGFTPVKTSSSPPPHIISHFRYGERGRELLQLMLREPFSGNLGNYLRSLKKNGFKSNLHGGLIHSRKQNK